jgi:hypothetical protein
MKATIFSDNAANLTGGNRGNGDLKDNLCSLRFLLFNACTKTLAVGLLLAGVHYVNVGSTNATPPYTNWATAATNIQDAVDAAVAGEEIVVTNGIYANAGRSVDGVTSNRVAVDKALSLRSVNGPQSTMIDGGQSLRCVYLTNSATLSGFTLLNGVSLDVGGGGVWCASSDAVVSNCVIAGNQAWTYYGDACGGGAYGGTLNNCTLTGNSVRFTSYFTVNDPSTACGGGAAYCTLNRCTLSGNSVTTAGAFVADVAQAQGGGAAWCILNNCSLTGNSASVFASLHSSLAFRVWGGGAFRCTLNDCTLTGNSAAGDGGCPLGGCRDISGGGTWGCTLNNCVVYFNTVAGPTAQGPNYYGGSMNYCCTTPLAYGSGIITNVPLFVDYSGANLRPLSNSPCINAGNNAYAPAGPDLDGNPRIAGGTVDIGAYEFQSPASMISYAWLQHYGLPTDGSADYSDPDGDGMNNRQEWICGTDPTNALSVLRLLSPAKGLSGVAVTWQSVNTRTYSLERSSNLGVHPPFVPLATNIPGQTGTTAYTDTNAIGAGPWFYRVGVRN